MSLAEVVFPNRFRKPAQYYTTGRPTYPKLLSKRVATLVELQRSDRVLDLGTGPGFLAIDFAAHADSVTGIDPSEDMLAAAIDNAKRAGVSIQLIRGSSFGLGAELGKFKLVTIGRAFHWMEREQTLASLNPLVERGGGVALFGERYPEVPSNEWYPPFQALLDSYSVEDPARGRSRDPIKNETIFLRSNFDHLERISVLERRLTPVGRFVDRALSFGAAWDGRPGSREEDLAHEVRELIGKYANSSGVVHEVVEGHALIGLRSADL